MFTFNYEISILKVRGKGLYQIKNDNDTAIS